MGTTRGSPTRHLEAGELDDVIERAQRVGNAHLLRRLCFLKNRYAGDSATEAGRRVGVSSATASRWARRWEANGVDGLRREARSGRPPSLDEDDRKTLTAALEHRPRWTAEEVRRLIESGFGVSYSTRHVYRIVGELGMDERIGRTAWGQGTNDDRVENDAVRTALDSVRQSDDTGSGKP